eukprot:TRINITY_DN11013_c1_g1_i1.p1 TRINITY_DN11013_c1_g1~~TRINITY_DN11013_c1_g1_i1.p1  ORF type:complete len:627 (+),score=154.07 TRINITY_DN11013_c1_g1_i1:46-1881(+)
MAGLYGQRKRGKPAEAFLALMCVLCFCAQTSQQQDPAVIVDVPEAYVRETGNFTILSVRLSVAPSDMSEVTCRLQVDPSNQLSFTPGKVVFTTANWQVAASVNVTGNDNSFAEGLVPVQVTPKCTSTVKGGLFSDVTGTPFTIYSVDDEDPRLVLSATSITTSEENPTAVQFSVTLTAQPRLGDVVVYARIPDSARNEGGSKVNPGSTVITQKYANAWWDAPGFIHIVGKDDVAVDGDHIYNLSLVSESEDPALNGLTAVVQVTNLDNDGYTAIRYTPLTSRGESAAVDTAELKLRAITNLGYEDVNLTASKASCYYTGVSGGCPGGADVGNINDGDPRSMWRTLAGSVNADIYFDRPRTICKHAISFGGGEDMNPTRWSIAVQKRGSDTWHVIYNRTEDYPRLGPLHTTPYEDACPPNVISTYTDPPAPPPVDYTDSGRNDTDPPVQPPEEDDDSVIWLVITVIIVFVVVMVAVLLVLYRSHPGGGAHSDGQSRSLNGSDAGSNPIKPGDGSPGSGGYLPMGVEEGLVDPRGNMAGGYNGSAFASLRETDPGHINDELAGSGSGSDGYNIIIMYSGRGGKRQPVNVTSSSPSHPLPSEEGFSSRFFRREY